uniref:Insulin-like androgenic gland factor n=1 Tax=Cherax destructor TaxID=6723 RepID=B3GQK2_CHEDE|nr:insulin-like androgenic gland factor [Cherax destructor]
MLSQTLLNLILVVVVMVPLPSASYRVDNLLIDFDCGHLADTMDSICRTYKEFNDTRAVRSARDTSLSGSVSMQGPGSEVAVSQLYHPRGRKLGVRLTVTDARLGEQEATTVSREAANTFIKTQNYHRRRRDSDTTDNTSSTNVYDECCSEKTLKTCVFDEIAQYCEQLEDGIYVSS